VQRRLVRIAVPFQNLLRHEAEMVFHAAVAEGIGFDLLGVAALRAGDRQGTIVEINDVERTATFAALSIMRINSHGTPRAEGSGCLPKMANVPSVPEFKRRRNKVLGQPTL